MCEAEERLGADYVEHGIGEPKPTSEAPASENNNVTSDVRRRSIFGFKNKNESSSQPKVVFLTYACVDVTLLAVYISASYVVRMIYVRCCIYSEALQYRD